MHAAAAVPSSLAAGRRRIRFPSSVHRFPSSFSMPHFPSSLCVSSPSTSPLPQTLALTLTTAADSPSLVAALKPIPQKPWLLVGLGNPGKKYQGTRHNVGFQMLDAIAEAEGISMGSMSFKALFGKGFIGNVPVMLAKPQTFMNLSGQSIFDDLDLPFAKLRLLPKGGHGGHNGMRSVIDHFKGNRDFPRLRIGIGRPPGKMDPINFVLRPFNKQESNELEFTYQTGLEAVRILLMEGFDKSCTFVNSAKSLEQLS